MMLLEEIFKTTKVHYSEAFNLRIQRALSWLKKSIELEHDYDFQFISLWISLNALYGRETSERLKQQDLELFFQHLYAGDQEKRIILILWDKHSAALQGLLDNTYMTPYFWDYQHGKISRDSCHAAIRQEKQEVQAALQHKDPLTLLRILFHRLATLHQQILQGGVSYASVLNRKQMQDSCRLLSTLLHAFLYILLENAEVTDSGQPFYPVVQVN